MYFLKHVFLTLVKLLVHKYCMLIFIINNYSFDKFILILIQKTSCSQTSESSILATIKSTYWVEDSFKNVEEV